jgi:hypothetical protein
MARFRAEAVTDPKTGMAYVEQYHPDDSSTPFAKSAPVYPSHEAALADVVQKMKTMWPEKPVTVIGGGNSN